MAHSQLAGILGDPAVADIHATMVFDIVQQQERCYVGQCVFWGEYAGREFTEKFVFCIKDPYVSHVASVLSYILNCEEISATKDGKVFVQYSGCMTAEKFHSYNWAQRLVLLVISSLYRAIQDQLDLGVVNGVSVDYEPVKRVLQIAFPVDVWRAIAA